MGMSPLDFEILTPAEFIYAWAGWMKLEKDRIIHSWETTRWQTWVLTSIQLDRKDRKLLEDMFPMPWDNKSPSPTRDLSIEERKERVNKIMQCVNLQNS